MNTELHAELIGRITMREYYDRALPKDPNGAVLEFEQLVELDRARRRSGEYSSPLVHLRVRQGLNLKRISELERST